MILDQPSSALLLAMHQTVLARPASKPRRLIVHFAICSSDCVHGLVGGRPKSTVARRRGHSRPESRPSDLLLCLLLELLQLIHTTSEIPNDAGVDNLPLAGAGRETGAGMLGGWSPETASGAQPSSVGEAALPCIPSLCATSRARWSVHPSGRVPPVLRFTFSRAWVNATGSSSSLWKVA